MPLNNFLDHKVIWITGASSGLGRELAIELSKYSVKLILSARQEDKLIETQKLCHCPEDHVLLAPLDLSHIDGVYIKSLEKKILKAFGSLDLLIHNASISQRSLALKTQEEVERTIMETIYFGPLKMTKVLSDKLLENPNAQLAIISSLAGKFGVPLRSSYSAAKHALHGYFEALSIEMADQLPVQFFVLGGVRTDSAKHALTAEGRVNNLKDRWHDRNMPADVCAKKIIRKLPKRRGEYLIAGIERFGYYLYRLFPSIHKKILRRFCQKERLDRAL